MHRLATPIDSPWPGCRLWRIDLAQPVPAEAIARLSAQERARADAFAFEQDRRRYLCAHAALHGILCAVRGPRRAALAAEWRTGPFGKPALADAATPHFNLSHSGATGVVAVSDTHEVGVDIELLRPVPDALDLSAAYFRAAEHAALQALPPALRATAFLRAWTRKEAVLKAVGTGLGLDPQTPYTGLDGDLARVQVPGPSGRQATVELATLDLPGAIVSVARCAVRAPAPVFAEAVPA